MYQKHEERLRYWLDYHQSLYCPLCHSILDDDGACPECGFDTAEDEITGEIL